MKRLRRLPYWDVQMFAQKNLRLSDFSEYGVRVFDF